MLTKIKNFLEGLKYLSRNSRNMITQQELLVQKLIELQHQQQTENLRLIETVDKIQTVLQQDFSEEINKIKQDFYEKINIIQNERHLQLINELKNVENTLIPKLTDTQIRTHNTQDKVHDILWKNKISDYHRDIMFWQLYRLSGETLEETKLRFFRSLPKVTDNSRKSQLVLEKLLQKIHNACTENNLDYWLDFGTLLGAIRHHGFIPWDDDIDLGMMRNSAEKLALILEKDKDVLVRNFFINDNHNGIHQVLQIQWAPIDGKVYNGCIDIFFYDFCEEISTKNWTYLLEKRKDFIEYSKEYPKIKRFKNEIHIQLKEALQKYYAEVKKAIKITETETEFITFGFDNFYYGNYKDIHMFKKDIIFPLKKLKFEGNEYYVPNEFMQYISAMYTDIFSLPDDILTHKHFNLTKEETINNLNFLYSRFFDTQENEES